MMVSRATIVLFVFIQESLGHAVPEAPILRIAGGDTVDIEDVPYMASVHIAGSLCGGSIIHEQFVLTAAHCVKKRPRSSDYVRVGSRKLYEGGKKYSIMKYISHEKYKKDSLKKRNFDLGLLKLSRRLTFGTTVAPIKLEYTNVKMYPGLKAYVSGWGRTAPEVRTHTLHQVSVSIQKLSTCINYFGNKRLTYKNICTLNYGAGACSGDSGGPLVVGGRQVGVYSAGKKKKCGYAPGIYVNVTAHMDWIQDKLFRNYI